MKKILVVLLMLAVATGVFALDGDWSMNGAAEIGTTVDFDKTPATIWGSGYNYTYKGWGPINGYLNLGYNWDSFSSGIKLQNRDWDPIGAWFEWDGENYKFSADVNLGALITKSLSFSIYGADTPSYQDPDASANNNAAGDGIFGRLWGYYKFLNGLVHLEVAYKARDNGGDKLWQSDTTAAFNNLGGSRLKDSSNNTLDQDGKWGIDRDTFSKVDHHQMLLANVVLSNLNFGIQFKDNLYAGNFYWHDGDPQLVRDVMKKIIIGFKFDMQPVEVAAQFRMGDYGVYFGGRWFIGPVTAGLSFTGILGSENPKEMKFGGGVEYKPGVFGASINGYYALEKEAVSGPAGRSQIGIVPSFFYNVIPTHLRFQTDFGFYLNGGKNDDNSKKATEVAWAVQPQLFWNFLGTGADDGYYGASGGWSGRATGIIVRYRLVSGVEDLISDNSKLDVTFRWHF
jgi:hypothetical protein